MLCDRTAWSVINLWCVVRIHWMLLKVCHTLPTNISYRTMNLKDAWNVIALEILLGDDAVNVQAIAKKLSNHQKGAPGHANMTSQ